jgi:putative transposase
MAPSLPQLARRLPSGLIVKKYQTGLTGFHEKILWLYAHGLSPQLISNVTEAVLEEVRQWQNRPLKSLYPIVYMDCLVVKVKENQRLINKAVYLALSVTMEGQKEL